MRLLKRYKNYEGITIAYDVEGYNNKEKIQMVNLSLLIFYANEVENAELRGEDFVAKKGYTIETIIDTSSLDEKDYIAVTDEVKNLENIVPISYEDFYGKHLYKDCLTIRKYAQSGRLEILQDKHRNSDCLFKFIEACGITVEKYITGYLSVLQPYSMQKLQGSKNIDGENIWSIDVGYKTSLVIEVSSERRDNPIVVSFHESINKGNFIGGANDFLNKKCPVIIDKYEKELGGYSVSFTVQRGFIRFNNIHAVTTSLVNNSVALIDYNVINIKIKNTMDIIYQRISDSYTDDISNRDIVSVYEIEPNKLSISSIGYSPINNLCLLIDMYDMYTDTNSRSVLTQIASDTFEEVPNKSIIKETLKEKYIDCKNKLFLALMDY